MQSVHAEQTDRTSAELQVRYQEETGRSISYSSVRRLLAQPGVTRKKKDAARQWTDAQRDRAEARRIPPRGPRFSRLS
jgi:transposase